MRRPTVLALTLLCTVACRKRPEPVEAAPAAPQLDLREVANCEGCHDAVVKEWRESMHARAHHDEDPIYGSMRALRMKKQGDQVAGKCAQCHTPLAPGDVDSPLGKIGVACATCHAAAHVDTSGGKKGAQALELVFDGVARGPYALTATASPAHGVARVEHLANGEGICLACHDVTRTPAGAPACQTGEEYAERETAQSCADCHMPEVEGASGVGSKRTTHRRHVFGGPHRAWYQDDIWPLSEAVTMSGELRGRTAKVSLRNQSGHGFPSAFPGRVAMLKVVGMNAKGEAVFTNFEEDPMKESPVSVFNKVYVDAEGKPTLPPFADKLARDNRLRTDETRTLEYSLPRGVKKVVAKLIYRLGPPALFEKLGLEGAPESTPKVIETLELSR